MAKVTVWFGLALVALGVVAYVGSGQESPTALLPAAVGLVLAALGVLGQAEERRAMAMHLAAALALVGLLGSLGRLVPALLSDDELSGWAAGAQAGTVAILGVYLAMSIRSFKAASAARKARQATTA